MNKIKLVFLLIISSTLIYCQGNGILPAQMNAIQTLAADKGFSDEALNTLLYKEYGTNLSGLSKTQAIELIQSFQSNNAPQSTNVSSPEPVLADILEIGMSKKFYLKDGNVIRGDIIDIADGRCHIVTTEGTLKIPMTDILEETVDITKNDDARYKGPLLQENQETLIVRSNYGDVTINKKDIKTMDRYHGGKLIPWIENKQNF
ncbi:uncharacterized protein METZ01_LOCUS346051, partial [marine metagenome]